jgi:hypothetical protein
MDKVIPWGELIKLINRLSKNLFLLEGDQRPSLASSTF